MDRALTAQITESARHLLSSSDRFEPYDPKSLRNSIQALQLLDSLFQDAEASLKSIRLPAPAAPHPQVSEKAKSSQAPAKPTLGQLISQNQLTKKQVMDKKLIEALLKMKQTQPSFRRTPGMFSPILRSNPSTS